MLPDEIWMEALNERYPCRELQISQLATLYTQPFPSPSTLIIHGLQATGKTSITKCMLAASEITHAIIDSKECITGRHLLERTLASCLDAIIQHEEPLLDRSPYQRCENIAALFVHLQRLLQNRTNKFILVFDGIDKQREAPPTLLPALARITEQIPNFSIIFIISVPRPWLLHTPGVPYIHFPPYNRDQCIQILATSPPSIFLDPIDPEIDYTNKEHEEDSEWVWTRFITTVWDSLAKGAARDILSFEALCTKLWRPFVAPIVDGTFGTRDFTRLMVSRRHLFQSEDMLLDSVVPKPVSTNGTTTTIAKPSSKLHDLPYYSKYLLCAAYLASYNPTRTDTLFFMKSTERKKRKRGGGTAKGRMAKNRKIPRNLLNPSPFPLDRLLAIFRAILPDPVPQTADLYTQIATLASLRLLIRMGAAGADVLDPACKWRVSYGWEWISAVGRTVGCELSDYLAMAE